MIKRVHIDVKSIKSMMEINHKVPYVLPISTIVELQQLNEKLECDDVFLSEMVRNIKIQFFFSNLDLYVIRTIENSKI